MTDDSYKLDEVSIRVPDLMNLVDVLKLVLGVHQAEDIAKCHRNLIDQIRYSPLTLEIEAVRDRFDGHVTDYWAKKGREQAEATQVEPEPIEAEGEPLDATPLGAMTEHRAPKMEFEYDEEQE